MKYVDGLRCRECRKEYPISPIHVCEFCFGPLEVIYKYEEISKKLSREKIEERPKSMWKHRELLTFDDDPILGIDPGSSSL